MTETFASTAVNPIRIGIVVGEASGDVLGAGLMRVLKQRHPNIIFEGIGGPKMLAEGFHSLYPQDRLAVMGLWEPLKRLPELLGIRRGLKKHFILQPPHVMIGIDSPDFNLDLELSLRQANIKTVHYVSPSVWAWRSGRIKKIARAVNLMLTLFPFEEAFYREKSVPVVCVGHPLADQLPLHPNAESARAQLNLNVNWKDKKVIAILPGSRASEIQHLGPIFWKAAEYMAAKQDKLIFIVPAANAKRFTQLQQQLKPLNKHLELYLIEGQSHSVMEAADVVLMASGTTTLEAMLLKRPMVIAYKMAAFSYWLMSKMATVKYVGLPNLLAQKALVPEFLQDHATPVALGDALLNYLNNQNAKHHLVEEAHRLHHQLKKNADERAAEAVMALINGDPL